MANDLDDILKQLQDVQTRLENAPSDAYELRVELRDRRHELQADAARVSTYDSTTESLKHYLRQLELRRAAIINRRLTPSWNDGGVGGTGVPQGQTDELNRRIDEADDLPGLEREIARIRVRLAATTES